MIAYIFPPMGGSGMQRTAKFAKYLPEFGWAPVILTVMEYPREEMDYSIMDDIPESVEIYRTPSFEPYRLFTRFVNKSKSNNKLQIGDINQKYSSEFSLKQRTIRFIKDFVDSLFIPDREIGWLPFALFRARKILKTESVDVIYSTSDPFTDHLIGYCIKRLSGKPWVADFRDPWTNYFRYDKSFRYRQKINRLIEKIIICGADRIVVISEHMRTFFREQYPEMDSSKFVVIQNGFDTEDFNSINFRDIDNEKFTITYVGRFSTPKNKNLLFFKVLQSILDSFPELEESIRIIFVGLFSQEDWGFVTSRGLEKIVETVGYQTHKKSIEYMLKSNALLLTICDERGMESMYNAKLYEYLAAKKPILALIPGGVAEKLIRKLDAGLIVHPNDESAIRKAILDYYERWLNGTLVIDNPKSFPQYERKTLTGSLAKCLNEASDNYTK